jgi:hypothetical protein
VCAVRGLPERVMVRAEAQTGSGAP